MSLSSGITSAIRNSDLAADNRTAMRRKSGRSLWACQKLRISQSACEKSQLSFLERMGGTHKKEYPVYADAFSKFTELFRRPSLILFGISFFMLTVAVICATGCGESADVKAALKELYKPKLDVDVSSSPEYNFSSFTNTVWKTKVKVAIADLKGYKGDWKPYLLTPYHFDPAEPRYTPIPGMKLNGLLPVGTRLRVERLMHDPGVGGELRVEAMLLDVTNSEEVVTLGNQFLAKNRYFDAVTNSEWTVNPEILEK